MKPLEGKIALVAGATRGAGRGIATALGEAGATVYCTGRSVAGKPGMKNRPETIHETAELVTARGGRGIAIPCDHTDPRQVGELFERIGELDLLVNDIWGGDELTEWGKRLWETNLGDGLTMIDRAIKTHIITSYHALPRIRRGGLVVEITDGDSYFYRGHFFYDLVKTAVIRMAFGLSQELKGRDVTAVAKKELAGNPIVRLAGALADAVFIDRDNRAGAIAALRPLVEEALLRGKSLAVAPEGTRSGTGRLGPFKKGAFRLAMAGGVPVVPIVFRNANDVWPLGTQFMRPGTVDVVVHPPIATDGWTDETLDAHIADVRGLYLDTLANWPVA